MSALSAAPLPSAAPARSAVPAVDLALLVLEHLAAARAATPTELARTGNLPRIGVTRVLQALLLRGYVHRDPATSRYALTARLFTLAAKAPALDLAAIARPRLEQLRDATGETAEWAVLDGDDLLLVAAADSREPIRLYARPGDRASLYRMATGKAILATLPEAIVTRLFNESKLTAKPEYTPRSLKALLTELAAIASHGYATDQKKSPLEVERIAVALRDASGQTIGAIGIAGPVSRLKVTSARIAQVQAAARDLARDLGLTR